MTHAHSWHTAGSSAEAAGRLPTRALSMWPRLLAARQHLQTKRKLYDFLCLSSGCQMESLPPYSMGQRPAWIQGSEYWEGLGLLGAEEIFFGDRV